MLSGRFDQQVASLTIVLLASFPFSFYYGAAYTESIYLLAVVVAFYGIEQQACGWLV
jgi:Gpi18-like mannosyltransferase